LAKQIDSGVGDAARLVAESGWSWNLSFALVRAINGDGSNAAALAHEGIPARAARAIASAISARQAPTPAAVEPVAMSKAWRGIRGDYRSRGFE
jgi:hypothetical protein